MDNCCIKEVEEIIELIPKIPFGGLKLEEREKVERHLSCMENGEYLLSDDMLKRIHANGESYYNKESAIQYLRFLPVAALVVSLASAFLSSGLFGSLEFIVLALTTAFVILIFLILLLVIISRIVSANRRKGKRHNAMLLAYSVGAELNRRELRNVLNNEG